MQDFNSVQMRALPTETEQSWVSGCNNQYKFVLSAGAEAKTMTTERGPAAPLILSQQQE
jgi:hypothetical protein